MQIREFIYHYNNPLMKKLECPICLDILKSKYCLCKFCGQNFCLECVDNILSINKNAKCPLCKSIHLRQGVVRGRMDLCSIIKGKCSSCEMVISRSDFNNVHLKTPCPEMCSYGCYEYVINKKHDHNCSLRKEKCPICPGEELVINMKQHIMQHLDAKKYEIRYLKEDIKHSESRINLILEYITRLATLNDKRFIYRFGGNSIIKKTRCLSGKKYWNLDDFVGELEFIEKDNMTIIRYHYSPYSYIWSGISSSPIPEITLTNYTTTFGIIDVCDVYNILAIGITTRESYYYQDYMIGHDGESYGLVCYIDVKTELYGRGRCSINKSETKINKGNIIKMVIDRLHGVIIYYVSKIQRIDNKGSIKISSAEIDTHSDKWVRERINELITKYNVKESLAYDIAEIEQVTNYSYLGHIDVTNMLDKKYHLGISLRGASKIAFLGEEF